MGPAEYTAIGVALFAHLVGFGTWMGFMYADVKVIRRRLEEGDKDFEQISARVQRHSDKLSTHEMEIVRLKARPYPGQH